MSRQAVQHCRHLVAVNLAMVLQLSGDVGPGNEWRQRFLAASRNLVSRCLFLKGTPQSGREQFAFATSYNEREVWGMVK